MPAIGNTPLIKLERLTEPGWAEGGHYAGPDQAYDVMEAALPNSPTPQTIWDNRRFWDDTTLHIVKQITRILSTRYIKKY